MLHNFTFVKSAAALSVLVLVGFDEKPDGAPPAGPVDSARVVAPERLGRLARASELIGREVKNRQAEKLGKVTDLAVDIEGGRVVEVILSSGGTLGIGDKTFAVPPGVFSSSPEAPEHLWLDVSQAKLAGAPAFESSKWEEWHEPQRVRELYRYYGQEPQFVAIYQLRDLESDIPRLGHVSKASKVLGTKVTDQHGEKLGTVEDLTIALEKGRIVHAVLSTGGFLGAGDDLHAIPPIALRYNTERDSLVLATTKQGLAQAPRFKKDRWSDLDDPEYSTGVYRAYGAEPFFGSQPPDADNTGRNVRDREDRQLTPTDQGSSATDVDLTRRIRKALIADDTLSLNARNVKVITIDGRVTLRGPVDSEEERRVVEGLAHGIAAKENVDSQLEVRQRANP